jgi:hypothetical protein
MMTIIIIIIINKPNIIIRDNEKGICMAIDVEIARDRNVVKKEADNSLKHKDLKVEIQRMWNVKAKVTTGTISKSFRKYLSSIPRNMISRSCRKQLYWAQHTYF